MATPRKRWFRVYDKVLRKQWSNDELASLVRLMAYLNGRWARDGVASFESGHAEISINDLMTITGKRRPDVARTLAERWPNVVSMSVQHRGDVTVIIWHTYPEYQGFESEPRAESALELPPPRPASRVPRQKREESASGASAPELFPEEPEPDDGREPIPHLDAEDRQLLNLIARKPGTPGEKEHWLAESIDQLKLRAAEIDRSPQSLVIPWYQQYLKGDREHANAPTLAERAEMRRIARQMDSEARDPPRAANPAQDPVHPST